jgi:tRNA-binding protein
MVRAAVRRIPPFMSDTSAAFAAVDIRTGTIVAADALEGARTPAYRLRVDFGAEIGERSSSARLVDRYAPADLVGKQVLGVVNLPPKRIAGFVSEALVLGVADDAGAVVLVAPETRVANGARLF